MGMLRHLSLALATTGLLADARKPPIPRPNLSAFPLQPTVPFPHSPRRCRTCYVPSSGGDADDAPAILQAFKDCNKGGSVVLDGDYLIGSPLDLTFLEAVDVVITGTVKFTDDVDYWTANTFKYAYQDASAMWRFGGKDVNIYGDGDGVIDGNGQAWYDAMAADKTVRRPQLLIVDGLEGGSISNLKMRNSPNWFNLIANSSSILITDMDLKVASTNENPAKNGDGWDTFRSDNIVIQNSVIDNSDDCVSFKPNSTNVVVQGLRCNGSHGISVGSLGQYPDEYDIVENIYIYNTYMTNAGDAARIKVWPGSQAQGSWNGGGGAGYVKNITYDDFYNGNNNNAIQINQCYGQKNQTLCNMYPSKMIISDVLFKNIYGTTSAKYDPRVGELICSSPEVCINIAAENITVTAPSGASEFTCVNMDEDLLDINCVPQ